MDRKEFELWKAVLSGLCANPKYKPDEGNIGAIDHAELLADAHNIMVAMGFNMNSPYSLANVEVNSKL